MKWSPTVPGGYGSRVFLGVLAVLLGAASLATSAFAADVVLREVDTGAYPVVRIDVALTADLVPTAGEPGFRLFENGIEIEGLSSKVSSLDRPPIDVILLVDTSGSMRGAPLAGAKDAAKRFVSGIRSEDRVALVTFSSEPNTVLDFTPDVAALSSAIDALEASGETALHDGLIQASKVFVDNERDRAIVVLSDGGDTVSINTLDVAAGAISSAGAPIYAVALESPEYDPAPLEQLATRSKGRFVAVQNANSLVGIFEEIAEELRNLYSLTYTSARPSTKDLEIEVLVANGNTSGAVTTAVENPIYSESAAPVKVVAPEPGLLGGMTSAAIGFLVFVSSVLAVVGVGSLITPTTNALKQLEYYKQYQDDLGDDVVREGTFLGSRAKVMGVVASIAAARGFTALARTSLERAGLPLRPNEYIFFHVLAAAVVTILVHAVGQNLLLTIIVAATMAFLPIAVIQIKADRRGARFEEQLPDVLSLIAGSLRAGWGFQQGLELVVDEISEPAASEFRRVQSEARFGLPLEQALGRMAERLDSEDFRWTVSAITIQREVGGNLAEVLDIVAATIRTRAELRRHVSSLTAESRYSAGILAIMPFFIVGAMSIVNPVYLAPMFDSVIGLGAMAFGGFLLMIGIIWILRLTKVEV